MKILVAVLIALCLWPVFGRAAQETIPERVRRHKGAIEVRTLHEFSPADLPEIAKNVDLIARVVVADAGRTRLSTDERSIYTEYTLQILDEYFSQRKLKPGETIVLRKSGGTLTIEGYEIIGTDSDFPAFEFNEEYILFLKFDPSTGQYVVPYGAQGAFRNVAGAIEQVSRDTGTWNNERGRVSPLSFIQELTDVLKSREP